MFSSLFAHDFCIVVTNPCQPSQPAPVVGEMPKAASTESGHCQGVKQHNEFAAENGFRQFKDLTTDYLDEIIVAEEGKTRCYHLFSRFANFLIGDDVGRDRKGLAPKTCAQCYSNFKNALADKLTGHLKVHEPNDEWHHHLYRLVKTKAAVRNMERGEATSDGSDSIWRDVLISPSLFLLKQGKSEVRKKQIRLCHINF